MNATIGNVMIDKEYSAYYPKMSSTIESKKNNGKDLFCMDLDNDLLSLKDKVIHAHDFMSELSINGNKNNRLSYVNNRINLQVNRFPRSSSFFRTIKNETTLVRIYIQPYQSPIPGNEDNIAIADMQSWVFRHAQRKWGKTASECAQIFKDNRLFEFISDCYEILHVSSYQCALEDIETILRNKGVTI